MNRPSATPGALVAHPTPTGPGSSGPLRSWLRERAAARPVGFAVTFTIAWLGVVAAGAFVLPGRSATIQAIVTAVLLLAAVGLSALLGRPERLGLSAPRTWRRPALLLLALGLALLPLLAGLRPVTGDVLAVLVVGYALTGVAEELAWRGIVLDVLRPRGIWTAAVVCAVLFGAGHLSNVLYRGSLALVLAQAFGAALFGFGYAALALRTGALPVLMLAHFLTDLVAQVTALPTIPVLVAQDTVLLVVGVLVLRGRGVGNRP